MTVLLILFQVEFIAFLYLLCMPWLGFPKLNKAGESGHCSLVCDIRGNSFWLLSIMLTVGLSYVAFIILMYVPSLPTFWIFFFIIYGYWVFVRRFFCIYWDNLMIFLLFNLLIWYIILMYLYILKNPCISWINATWWCMILLIRFIIFSLLEFCWGFLHLYSSLLLTYNFLFLWYLCLILVPECCWPHRISLGVFFLLQFLWNSFIRIDINSSLNVWWNLPMKPFGPGHLFIERLLITLSISVHIGLHIFYLFLFQSWKVVTF